MLHTLLRNLQARAQQLAEAEQRMLDAQDDNAAVRKQYLDVLLDDFFGDEAFFRLYQGLSFRSERPFGIIDNQLVSNELYVETDEYQALAFAGEEVSPTDDVFRKGFLIQRIKKTGDVVLYALQSIPDRRMEGDVGKYLDKKIWVGGSKKNK